MFWKRVNLLVKTLSIVPNYDSIPIHSHYCYTEAKSLQKSSYAWLAHLCPCPTDDSSIQGAHGNTPLPLKQGQWSFTNHCINNSLLTSVYALHGNSGILEAYVNAQSSPASTGLKILINHCIKTAGQTHHVNSPPLLRQLDETSNCYPIETLKSMQLCLGINHLGHSQHQGTCSAPPHAATQTCSHHKIKWCDEKFTFTCWQKPSSAELFSSAPQSEGKTPFDISMNL